MKTKFQLIFVLFLLPGIFLSACGSIPSLEPTTISTLRSTPKPTEPPQPTQTPAATSPPNSPTSAVSINCDDWASIDEGEYQAQNNTWGKGSLSGWSQCIGLESNVDGTVIARWTWDWLNTGYNVKAYPEIVFGQKPGGPTTSVSLPEQIKHIDTATVSYEVTSTYSGNGNVAFDIWLTDTSNPSTWGAPPITHEIMIWLDRNGNMSPGGVWKERVKIDDAEYSVYVGEGFGDGWKYIAFVRTKPQLGAGTLELANFLTYMLEKDLVTGDEYLASIEFGNEVVSGAGETIISRYAVSINSIP
jgi:Glycosyl hydrolase family 12